MSELDDMIDIAYDELAGTDYESSVAAASVELAELRANQLPSSIVAAVRAYQEAFEKEMRFLLLEPNALKIVRERMMPLKARVLGAIEADAKERG